jgi:serine protease Do
MRLLPSVCGALTSLLLLAQATSAGDFDRRTAIVKAVEKTKESIVTIKTIRSSGKKEVAGTGVIVDERGLIISNRHVVKTGRDLYIQLSDGTEVVGDVLVSEAKYDLAVVRIKAGKTLKALSFRSLKENLMVGEDVIAIGHPYGYVNTVSRGIISALEREITLPSGDVLTGLIQTDASINPGNSGGPLLNVNGELIGINVALREGANGIAFAINAGTVDKLLASHFSALKVSGIMHGLQTQEKIVSEKDDAQRLVVAAPTGELKSGDMILAVATRPVSTSFDLERALWGKKVGETVEVKVQREGRELSASLTLTAGQGAGAVASAPATTPSPITTANVPAGNRP